MSLEISNLHLPLNSFALEFDAILASRVTGLFGASGAGKTSLLETIAGLRRPPQGRIVLDGMALTDAAAGIFRAPETRGIGFVPQDAALFTHLNVRQNLCYSQRTRSRVNRPGISYEHVVEVLNIGPLGLRRIASLSGGEKQRVAFGRALLAAPALLLLDEPLASLDSELKDQILPYLQKIRDEFNIPMLLVSHDADEMVALCDEVLVLETGHCIKRGAPSGVFIASGRPHHVLAKIPARSPVSFAGLMQLPAIQLQNRWIERGSALPSTRWADPRPNQRVEGNPFHPQLHDSGLDPV